MYRYHFLRILQPRTKVEVLAMKVQLIYAACCLVIAMATASSDLRRHHHPVVERGRAELPLGAPKASEADIEIDAEDGEGLGGDLSYLAPYAGTGVFPYSRIRLPTDVKPHGYSVRMRCDLPEFTYRGHVTMYAKVTRATDFVVFHSKLLTLKGTPKVKVNRKTVKIVNFMVSDRQQQVTCWDE